MNHRESHLPAYYADLKRYRLPKSKLIRAWHWYAGDVVVQSIRLLRTNGTAVRTGTGVSRIRQLREMILLSTSMPSMPENYYKYELYRPENRAMAQDYLHGHETWPLFYPVLTGDPGVRDLAPLDADKLAFAKRALANGLAVAPTLALIQDGDVTTSTDELPRADLFVKPLVGARGKGVRKWYYREEFDGYSRSEGDEHLPRSKFLAMLAARPLDRSVIVQPCLTNHQELAGIALDALATCRVITIINEDDEPEPVISIFRMPAVRGAVVDNMHRGGVAAPVDIKSGLLGAATDYAVAGPAIRHTHHPASGEVIEGRTLPLWGEVLDLAVRAHQTFRPRILVGWDISIGPEGPVIVEGNERPGVGGLQRLHAPLGRHRFGELLTFHLTARLES